MMEETIIQLVQQVKTIDVNESGKILYDYFEHDSKAEGVVVTDNSYPAGLVMRNFYYQKIGQQYGFSLYSGRSVKLLMKTDILILDAGCGLAQLGYLAMDRNGDDIYDFVIVMSGEKIAGVISIRRFLVEMSKIKEREVELLKNQSEILRESNEKEKSFRLRLEQMNKDLNIKNASVKNLLDNTGQGFLTINENLIISDEFSSECLTIFGYAVGRKNIELVFLPHLGAETTSFIVSVFKDVFLEPNENKQKVYMSLLPEEIMINDRNISIDYKLINYDDVKSIMLILTDITEKKQLEHQMEDERLNLRLCIKAVLNKSDIISGLEDFSRFYTGAVFEKLGKAGDIKSALTEIYREIHTLKGDFAQLSMTFTSNELHIVEDSLQECIDDPGKQNAASIAEIFKYKSYDEIVSHDISIIKDTLGEDFFKKDDVIQIEKKRIIDIEKMIASNCCDKDRLLLLKALKKLRYINFKQILRGYNEYLKYTALRLGKEIDDLVIEGDDIFIDNLRYRGFTKSLVNIFRNIADHGIETPDERIDCGKSEKGRVYCCLRKLDEDLFELSISDDGRGIDLEKIKNKALQKGLYTSEQLEKFSDNELNQLIFMNNFSTKDNITAISGRGMGLSAVMAEAQKTGGSVDVLSRLGKGTEFKIRTKLL